jgi:hypothetical protein
VELQHGGSIYHWNGVLLHVDITTRVDINYAVMRIVGYLTAPTEVIFEGLEHTMCYLYFFRHMPIVYPRCPLNKKSLALHRGKGTAEFLPPEYGSTSYADYTRDIRDQRSVTSHMHLHCHMKMQKSGYLDPTLYRFRDHVAHIWCQED